MRAAAAVSLALALAAAPARAEDYEAALAAARAEATAGRWGPAAERLEAAGREWPQDYPLQLERAWYLFQAGRLGEARDGYRRAEGLSPRAVDPVLGLGWTAQRQGDAPEARRRFEAVLAAEPGNASAREGLGLLGAATRGRAGLDPFYTTWVGHPTSTWLGGAALSADGVVGDRLAAGALYRILGGPGSLGASGKGKGGGASTPPQHELHGSLGWLGAGWGASLHGGLVTASVTTSSTGATTTWAEEGALAGLSASWRPGPLGLELDGSALRTFYASGDLDQVQGTLALPLGERLVVRGGARAQRSPARDGLAGLASLELRGRRSAFLAAEVGEQARPVDLVTRIIWSVDDRLRWAIRAGGELPVGAGFSLRASLDAEGWRTARAAGDVDSTAWRGSLGLVLAF